MMLYRRRKALANLFDKQCEKNQTANCSENVIHWLYGLGLLNEEKVAKYLDENKGDDKSESSHYREIH